MTAAEVAVNKGAGYWLGSYRAMLRFELTNLRTWVMIALLIQLLMSAGMVFMYGFYFGDMPSEVQTFLVTGIPALALVPIGFVLVPSMIMQHKLRDTYDFVWSLPVPRIAAAAATFTISSAIGIPGTVLALWIADLRYDVAISVSPAAVAAILLVSLMATSVGFAFGHAIPDPRVASLLTNLIIFLVLLFSPIVVPITLFPDWWAAVHRVLPFWHMAVVVRAGLTEGLIATSVTSSYLVLGAWTLGSWLLAAWVVGRRR
ncbi:ABC transporter permease [Actinomycetota bacterium]